MSRKRRQEPTIEWLYFDGGYYKHRVRKSDYERHKDFPGNMIESHHTAPDGDTFVNFTYIEALGKEYTP